jgi:hypothetical protein
VKARVTLARAACSSLSAERRRPLLEHGGHAGRALHVPAARPVLSGDRGGTGSS